MTKRDEAQLQIVRKTLLDVNDSVNIVFATKAASPPKRRMRETEAEQNEKPLGFEEWNFYLLFGNDNIIHPHRQVTTQSRSRIQILGYFKRRFQVNNEAKERLRYVARRLTETAFLLACDDSSTEEEYQESVDALVNHLTKVRKRTHDLHREELPA